MTFRNFILWSGLTAIVWLIVAILYQVLRLVIALVDYFPASLELLK